MATRSYNINGIDEIGRTFLKETYTQISNSSARVNGKLRIRPQTYSLSHAKVMSHWQGNPAPPVVVYPVRGASAFGYFPAGWSWTDLENQAYARFQGKLRKGSASLGVTAASWRQSRDMIVNRMNHTRRTLDSSIAALEGNKGALKRLRKEREPLAGQVLEYEFGWAPLVSDLKAALTTVCDAVPDEWITSRASGVVMVTLPSTSSFRGTWDGKCRITYNARVAISNPNLWLLNRMGLINPGVVAWDLIPWSFVVNMFVNVNTMISSVTDEVGLSFSDRNITKSSLLGLEILDRSPSNYQDSAFTRILKKTKDRSIGGSLAPSLTVKLPSLNWELAVIASSLVVQRIKKINQLIRVL